MPSKNKYKITSIANYSIFFNSESPFVMGEMTSSQIAMFPENELDTCIETFRAKQKEIIKKLKRFESEGELSDYMAERALANYGLTNNCPLPTKWDDTLYSLDKIIEKQSKDYCLRMKAILNKDVSQASAERYATKLKQLLDEKCSKRILYGYKRLIDITEFIESSIDLSKLSSEIRMCISSVAKRRAEEAIYPLSEEVNRSTATEISKYSGKYSKDKKELTFFYKEYNRFYIRYIDKLKSMKTIDIIEKIIHKNKAHFKKTNKKSLQLLTSKIKDEKASQEIFNKYIEILKYKLQLMGKILSKENEALFCQMLSNLAKNILEGKLINKHNTSQKQDGKIEDEYTSEVEIEPEDEQTEVSSSESEEDIPEIASSKSKNDFKSILSRVEYMATRANQGQPAKKNESMEIDKDEEACKVSLLRKGQSNPKRIIIDSESEASLSESEEDIREISSSKPKSELDRNNMARAKSQPVKMNESMEMDEEVCKVPLLPKGQKTSKRVIVEDSESEEDTPKTSSNKPKTELYNIPKIKAMAPANQSQPVITHEPMEVDEEVCQVPLLRAKKSNRVISEDETVEKGDKPETKDLPNANKTPIERSVSGGDRLSLQKKIQKSPKPVVFSKDIKNRIEPKQKSKTEITAMKKTSSKFE